MSEVVHELGAANGFVFADADTLTLRGFAKPVAVCKLLGRHGGAADRRTAGLPS